ncbi:MAG: hypothetical protein IPK57_07850 [Chitinophagaceae bacterium]|nr:hypothetical protein [Chitinophagaceae bacterium]
MEVSVVINNSSLKEEETIQPLFSYQVDNPRINDNSYRRFMEMQQQQ